MSFDGSWTRRESNPCPKTNSLSFYYHSTLLRFPIITKMCTSCYDRYPLIRPLRGGTLKVVSHIDEARFSKCECNEADHAAIKLRMRNLYR